MDTTVPPSQAAAAGAATEDKTVAILCYVTILGFIAAIFMHQSHKTELGAFHLRQMLGMVRGTVRAGPNYLCSPAQPATPVMSFGIPDCLLGNKK